MSKTTQTWRTQSANPEKLMMLAFPLITMGVFAGLILVIWLCTRILLPSLGLSAL
jgi:hypothetical protein